MPGSEETRPTIFSNIDFTSVHTTWVHRYNKDNLINELARRNLKTTGIVSELRNRLIAYLKGESTQDDFVLTTNNLDFIPNPQTEYHKSLTIKNTMDNKRPFFQPGTFSGNISENIDSFIKKFERAAIINGWSDTEKTQYIVVYLEGAAMTFYDNLVDSSTNLNWSELVNKLRLEFEPIAQTDMLRLMLEKRKQASDEQTVAYINEAESLCRRIDSKMSQVEMVRNIMKGLKPSIARYIGMLDNNTIEDLKKNVRKYEMIEFMITGEVEKSPFEIQTEIIKNNIQQINSNKNNTNNKLMEEIENLKQTVELLKNTQISNNNNPYSNKYQSNPTNNRFNNNYNRNKWQGQAPQRNHYNQKYQKYQQYNNKEQVFQSNLSNPNNNQFKNNTNTILKQCTFCHKTNHNEDECFSKRKTICQICSNVGHTANACHIFINKQKN